MDVAEFLAIVRASGQQSYFIHFTDSRNLDSIRQHGLLSTRELRARNIAIPAPGGNQWSLDADQASGMDAYVHLCFMRGHPMVHHAMNDGRIVELTYLLIKPEVIHLPGAMITGNVANQSGVVPGPSEEMLEGLDLEVIYSRTLWGDPAIQARLQAAHRCELLIPNHVPTNLIENL